MKTLETYIEILIFIKDYLKERKYLEEDKQLQQDLTFSESQIDSIISLIKSLMIFSKYLGFFSTLE